MTQYKAVLPEYNDNISHKSLGREFFTLTIALFVILFGMWVLLGFAVDYAVQWISPQRESAIFALLQEKFRDSGNEAQREIQKLVNRLKPCAGIDIVLQVKIDDNPEPNAMALPGGIIVINHGLLEQIESENGLAFVIAHELGHFKNRDHLRGLGRGLVLVCLSSFITGADSALTNMVTPMLNLGMARYSRAQERQADESALDILVCHYGHAGGATEFFETLGERDDFSGLHWFASHPQTQDRIAALQERIRVRKILRKTVKPLPQILQ